jgi:uncharacterized protein YeaO (DUF488 family)
MALRIVRLGSPRARDEGTRIGTVRRPPRGVAKQDWARRDFFDVWLPELAPSETLLKAARAAETDAEWKTFMRRYRSEMSKPEAQHLLQLLSVLSQTTAFSVGCYCEDEQRCHRSLLRELLEAHGARFA